MNICIQDVSEALGVHAGFEGMATGYSVDSRTLERGDLFFALRGPNHDGHEHVSAALARGAVAAVVDHDMLGACIRVPDTLPALQRLAGWARMRWGGEVIGVTGSAGKTTTKDAIAQMLGVKHRVGKTTGNFNNHVGVPLSLLRLPDDATHAVIEIGMNHAGEIRDLAAIARPQCAVVTNAGTAHIENFESIEGVAAAKRELVEALPADGTAVLNGDDERVRAFPFAGRRVTFGIENPADVRATIEGDRFRVGDVEFEPQVHGRHAVLNLLAGIAVSGMYGIEPRDLTEAVRAFAPGKMRGTRLEKNGVVLLDDSYNANPEAVKAMLDVLRDMPGIRRIAVLGEMLELGRHAGQLHREVGAHAAGADVDVLIGIRGAAREMVAAAVDAGMREYAAFFVETPEEAGDRLRAIAQSGDVVLFKGSRGTQVEKALQRFLE